MDDSLFVMPRKPRIQFADALYHVTSRGNARQVIFHGDGDRERFLDQLGGRVVSYGVVVYAFVLMDNHYHLLLRTPRGNLNRFMQRLNTSYALYYRYKHDRPGHVFQGRYKALLVTDDDYLLALSRYIHLNPVKTKKWKMANSKDTVAHLRSYRWSSYPSYAAGGSKFDWLQLDVLAHYGKSLMNAAARYRAYTEALITKDDDELAKALKEASQRLGPPMEETPTPLVRTPPTIDLKTLSKAVAKYFRVDPESLTQHGHIAGQAKRVAIELAMRKSGESLNVIGDHFGGISPPAICMCRKRLRESDLSHVEKIENGL
jgi:REP element-mobilizing transposase RayT